MPNAEQEKAPAKEAPTKGGVKLRRGRDTVTAHRPTTVTRLKSEGWEVVE